MKVKLSVVIVVLFMIISNSVFADGNPKYFGGMGFFTMGYGQFDLDELNSVSLENGYKEFDENMVIFGGEGYAVKGRLIIGGGGWGTNDLEMISKNGLFKQKLTAGCGMFKLGYFLFHKNGFSLYPMFGIGAGSMHLKIIQNNLPDFQGIMDQPMRSVYLHNNYFILNFELGIDYFLSSFKDKAKLMGMITGLRIGYNYSIPFEEWYLDLEEIPGGPELGLTGFYVRFVFGGGGLMSKRVKNEE